MDKQLEQKKILIEKIFKFLRVDFTKLDLAQKQAIVHEMLPFFFPIVDVEGDQKSFGDDFSRAYEGMKSYADQREERPRFEKSLVEGDEIPSLQAEIKESLNQLIATGRGKLISPLMMVPIEKNGIITLFLMPSAADTPKGRIFPNMFISNLNNLLYGIPLTFIRTCLNCEGYFLNLTRRKKEYCSPNCTWKALARKRREELKKHPRKYKAYLKKQKEIMKRKYEEKRKAEIGPNVKIKRRKEG